jgi:para-aminobenzoate synthetase / 4-amino-4-deoxychorismate lyase
LTLHTLIDFVDPDGAAPLCVEFGAPLEVLAAYTLDEVVPVLQAVQERAAQGLWCVGYVRYEASPAFDAALQVHAPPQGVPLVWFGVHAQPLGEVFLDDASAGAAPAQAHGVQPEAPTVVWRPTEQRAAFDACMATIHHAIAAGDLYQVNYTTQWRADVPAVAAQPQHLRAWFEALRRSQPHGYGAYIDTGTEQVLSVSPELFFDWNNGRLLMRPMKGTAERGSTEAEDAQRAQALRASAKEQAENVMIVDLVRNDVSRVAQPFSVKVPRLFHLQALPTVWQMTSDVQAHTRVDATLVDVFRALFPCGSVTGAPKVQAMRLIRQLEPQPRGVYYGAVGVVRPGGHATFNVAIRTVTVQAGQAHCGIGSGITADARPEAEWREWQAKRMFVERASQPFALLETLALQNGQLRHAPMHLARLQAAAQHFGYVWQPAAVQASLQALVAQHPQGLWRVRVLLQPGGQVHAQAFAMEVTAQPVRLALAKAPLLEAQSEFVRFKTTRRAHYDAFAPQDPEVFDTVLWNAQGEVTECTRGNVAFLLDGQWLTPPVACGLLPGVGRALALQDGRVREAVVRVEDVSRASAVAFINSLRGWLEASIEDVQT